MTDKPETEPQRVVTRPWLAPLIASGLALLLLLVLLIPGVLRYREGPDTAVIAALSDSNDSLRAEIERLGQASQDGVCVYEGAFYPDEVENREVPPDPSERLDLLPKKPNQVTPDDESLPNDAADFEGSMDDLLRASTVLVLNPGTGEFGFGTGFFVSDRQIATNAHVVGDAQTVIVTNDLINTPLKARVVRRVGGIEGAPMPQQDFALLELETPVDTAIPLSFAPPLRTQAVYASGYPGFFVKGQVVNYAKLALNGQSAEPPQGVVTDGIITTIQSTEREGSRLEFMAHSARISSGNSGGPLVDTCGRVVGINTFIRQDDTDGQFLHGDYALSAPNLLSFLTENGVQARFLETECNARDQGGAEAE